MTEAQYFDGHSADAKIGTAYVSGSDLWLKLNQQELHWPCSQLKLVPPVGSGLYVIELPNNARLLVRGGELVNQLGAPQIQHALIAWFEASWRWAFVALVLAVGSTWVLINYGVPKAARHVAELIPPQMESAISRDGLKLLDQSLFEPSRLTLHEQQRIQLLFEHVSRTVAPKKDYVLIFRDASELGPNAFALPGGTIVMTDQIIEISDNDQELAAILAHEIGHQQHRHSLRILLQNSMSTALIASISGDLTSISGLATSIPSVLLHSAYSREFEREADELAFTYLRQQNFDTGALSTLLLRIESQSEHSQTNGFLSTHPQSQERKPKD